MYNAEKSFQSWLILSAHPKIYIWPAKLNNCVQMCKRISPRLNAIYFFSLDDEVIP